MTRKERNIHPNFRQYQEIIVNHENYRSLPNKFSKKHEITWVKVKDLERAQWWDNLMKSMQLPDRASVARAIHPRELAGKKPCQICGDSLSINYEYLSAQSFRKLKLFAPEILQSRYEINLIQIYQKLKSANNPANMKLFETILNIQDLNEDKLRTEIKGINLNNLSPGVMSNAPDRLDGFHSFNACCRKIEDTGRHSKNLARYAQDRRAYEAWADGDWRGANRLMGVYAAATEKVACPSCGRISNMTADHIGPISLGFAHRMSFKPLCKICNSTKNNRMSLADVFLLLKEEKEGATVISWHSKSLWDSIKLKVTSDEDALFLSKLMRRNLHYVLTMLSLISKNGNNSYLLKFLNPQFAFFDFTFDEFNPVSGTFKLTKYAIDNLNSKRNADRYVRISYEVLDRYSEKEDKEIELFLKNQTDENFAKMLFALNKNDFLQADHFLTKLLIKFSLIALSDFDGRH